MPTAAPRRIIWPYLVVAIYGAVLLLPFLDCGAVLSRHEVLAAEPAREMLHGAPWSIQTFAGQLRTAKQPTMSWLIAGSMKLFHSRSTFACRFPSAIAGLITAVAVVFIGNRWVNRSTGFFAGLITVTAYWLQMQARLSEADMPLTAAVTVAMAVLVWGMESATPIAWLSCLFYAATGSAFMLKAPGVLVPISAGILLALWTNNARLKALLIHPLGLVVFCGFILIWPAMVLSQHHEMLQVWWREIGERSAGRFGREEPTTIRSYFLDLPFYLWWTPILMLPATPALVVGAVSARRQWPRDRWLMFAAWIIPWFAILTLLPLAKAKHYFLPALPPLSILAGWGTVVWMQQFRSRRVAVGLTWAWFIGCMAAILCVQAFVLPNLEGYSASAQLGRRASAMLPAGQRVALVGLEEAHVTFYLDPIPYRIDDPAKVPADKALYLICETRTLSQLPGRVEVLLPAETLRKGETDADRLVFARLSPAPR